MPDSLTNTLSEVIAAAGGTLAESPTPQVRVPRPPDSPFGSADALEGDSIRCLDVGVSGGPPEPTAFMDGIQRYGVIGRFGLVPIVRAHVAAAVLVRRDQELSASVVMQSEFLVASVDRLPKGVAAQLERTGLTLFDSQSGERPHPIIDVYLAARIVEQQRENLELTAAWQYMDTAPAGWLVVDGSLSNYEWLEPTASVVGVVKSHETQYLDGADLEAALTLKAGCRTSVFARHIGGGRRLCTWYLRLWPSEGHDLLYGLVRLERPECESAVAGATEVSRWVLGERAPLSAPDERWDRLLYPIHQVEEFLRARAGAWT